MEQQIDKKLGIIDFYRKKTVLITGTTGFVGKVILEKMLYSLQDVKIIVLIRKKKGSSVMERFRKEIMDSQCFSRLRQREEQNYVNYFLQRVHPMEGDLQSKGLGINPQDLETVQQNVQVIINSAASVDFQASLPDAIRDNVEGTLQIYTLATQCLQLQSLLHISTAYVNCNRREQWIEEQIYPLSSDSQLDLDPLAYIQSLKATPPQDIDRITQQELQKHNFPNTYTFTKHFTEKILQKLNLQHKLPLTILRPSIVGASAHEPYPGWIDSISAAAAFYMFIGLGVITFAKGKINQVSDQIPVDVVADSVLVAAAYFANNTSLTIYNCTTSNHNPVTWSYTREFVLSYFVENPLNKALKKPTFNLYDNDNILAILRLKETMPVMLYDFYSKYLGNETDRRLASKLQSATRKASDISKLFQHFTLNQWIFQSQQQSLLLSQLSSQDLAVFQIDVKKITWGPYFTNFSWGLKYFIMKEPIDPPFLKTSIVKTKQIESRFGDLRWINLKKIQYIPSSREKIIKRVLGNPEVINIYEQEGFKGYEKGYRICQSVFANYEIYRIKTMAYMLHKLFKRIFDRIVLDEQLLADIRKLESTGPVIVLANNQSHFDFLILSYIFFTYDIKPPYVQSSQNLNNIRIITSWLKACGGYFLDSNKRKNHLQNKIVDEYLKELLIDGANLEFFINKSRLRSGKLTKVDNLLLQSFMKKIVENKIPVKNLHIVPVALSYDVVYEADFIPLELVGEARVQESLTKFLGSSPLVFKKMGRVFVEFGKPINITQLAKQQQQPQQTLSSQNIKKQSQMILQEVIHCIQNLTIIMPIQIVSSVLLMQRKGISEDQLMERCDWVVQQLQKRGLRIGTISQFSRQISIKECLGHLKRQVTQKRDMFGPSVQPKYEHLTLQLLSYCRNGLLNPLKQEILMGCALFSFGHQMACTEGVSLVRAQEEFLFIQHILDREFLQDLNPIGYQSILEQMVKYKVLAVEQDKVKVIDDKMVTYLCSLCWPLVESYWVTIVYIFQLKTNPAFFTPQKLTQQIQWYAESLGEERVLEHFESVSRDSIGNALKKYVSMDILKKDANDQLELVGEDQMIKDLEQHLQKLMKHTFSKTLAMPVDLQRKNSLLDFPYISKL